MIEIFAGRRGRIAAGLLVSELSAATQSLVIAAIMPRIVADLHGLAEYPLAFGSFFAAMLIFTPFAGPWADRYGTRLVFAIGSAVMVVGLSLAALAPNMAAFTAARFIQGTGDALDTVMAFTAIAKTFEESLRPRMMSLLSAAWVLPAIVGPGLGALVTTYFGWRWVFAGFLPIVAGAALLVLPAISTHPVSEHTDAFAALRLLFSKATLRLQRGMHAALVACAFVYAGFLGADAYVALMLTGVRGISLASASVCITLAATGWAAASALQPGLLKRYGSVRLLAFGATATVLSTLAMATVALGAPLAVAYAAWSLGGAGIGFGYPTIMLVVMGGADEGGEGTVSSAAMLAGIAGMLAGILACGLPVTLAAHGALTLAHATAITFAIASFLGAILLLCAPRIEATAQVSG